MIFAYARVSTTDQNPDLEFNKMLGQLRPGDSILIWKLDRLGRSLRHLLDVVDLLNEQEAGLKSLTDPIDTTLRRANSSSTSLLPWRSLSVI